jgi:hypothetical protein
VLAACTIAPKPQNSEDRTTIRDDLKRLQAPAPKRQDIEEHARYGVEPTADAFRGHVDATLARVLKDPESRRVRFALPNPSAMWVSVMSAEAFQAYLDIAVAHAMKDPRVPKDPLLTDPSAVRHYYGYGMLVGVNAKNSFGGYTGEQLWLFLYEPSTGLRYWPPKVLKDKGGRRVKWGSPSWAVEANAPEGVGPATANATCGPP